MRGTTKESLGFIIEVMLFMLAGMFSTINILVACIFLILAMIFALFTGKQIAINAIEKYKGENK